MRLPESFTSRTLQYLHDEGLPQEGFIGSFDMQSPAGIRFNTQKVTPDMYRELLSEMDLPCDKVPWCSCGFYAGLQNPGSDPYYHAGVYYPQEASAMLPGQIISAKPGEKILDLCAAPGGKTCRIGEDLRGEGLLVANEINASRAKALLRNVERMGLKNTVILNETPENLAARLPYFFDKILVDAPCSGEGMFRRDPKAVGSWEKFGPESCVPIQREILESAHKMLRGGGELVYSTCTFCRDEDESMIESFLSSHPEYEVIRHDDTENVTVTKSGALRIWPHISRGDGHFCAHLRKNCVTEEFSLAKLPYYKQKRNDNYGFRRAMETYREFLGTIVKDPEVREEDFILLSNNIHLLSVPVRTFDGLKAVKLGDYPGQIKMTSTERLFVPSHSLALMLRMTDLRGDAALVLGRDDPRLGRYLKGETISLSQEEAGTLKKKGYIVICAGRFPIGFGKLAGNMSVKNMYPSAWRTVYD